MNRSPNIRSAIFAACACLSLLLAASAQANAAELLSIKSPPLGKGAYLNKFAIEIKHYRIVALCRVFYGWTITATNYAEAGDYKDGGSNLSGYAQLMHAALDGQTLNQLRHLALIEPDGTPGEKGFEGSIGIFAIGDTKPQDGPQQLPASAYTLEKADRCPR